MPSKRGKGTLEIGEKIALTNMGEKSIDNICPPLGLSALKKSLKILSRTERKSEGKRGVGGGCGNVVNPIGFSIISTAGARGERGR